MDKKKKDCMRTREDRAYSHDYHLEFHLHARLSLAPPPSQLSHPTVLVIGLHLR
jgi:hypothetical protein